MAFVTTIGLSKFWQGMMLLKWCQPDAGRRVWLNGVGPLSLDQPLHPRILSHFLGVVGAFTNDVTGQVWISPYRIQPLLRSPLAGGHRIRRIRAISKGE